jgi:hypothetical protein
VATTVGTVRAPAKHIETKRPGERRDPPRVCIYGINGFGKTTMLSSMPGRGLVLETPRSEGGSGDMVLADFADRIEVLHVESWADIDDYFWWIKSSEEFKAKKFGWLGGDTITGIKVLATAQTIRERDDRIVTDPHKITLPEHGKIGVMTSSVIDKFNTLALPIIWLAQERLHTATDDEGVEYSFVGPDISPAALRTLMPTLTLCGRLTAYPSESGGFERKLRIGPHTFYRTKTRAVSQNIVIPNQIWVGSPVTTELYDVLSYLLGKDVALNVVPEQEILELGGEGDGGGGELEEVS